MYACADVYVELFSIQLFHDTLTLAKFMRMIKHEVKTGSPVFYIANHPLTCTRNERNGHQT